MRITKLIEELEKLKSENGDLYVIFRTTEGMNNSVCEARIGSWWDEDVPRMFDNEALEKAGREPSVVLSAW